jgi:hypothetical protein
MTIAQLRAYANDEGIDLGGASAKDDIILAIMVAEGNGAEGRAEEGGGTPTDPGFGIEKDVEEEGEEGEEGGLMGQEDLAAAMGDTAPLVPPPVISSGTDVSGIIGEPTLELVAQGIIKDVATIDEAPLVSVGEADKELMPPSVLEVLNAQNMPYTEEALREQILITDLNKAKEGEENDNEVRAGGGTDPTRGTVRSA